MSFISASDITIRLGETFLFPHTSFVLEEGEHVAFLGNNGAGKSTLAKALAGQLPLQTGEIICHFAKKGEHPYPSTQKHRIAYISFETHQVFLQRHEKEESLQAFSTKRIKKTTINDILLEESKRYKKDSLSLVHTLGIAQLLDKSLSSLSNGQMRKVVIAKELIKEPSLIILDEPFEGLDTTARKHITLFIRRLMQEKNRCVIVITHHHADIPAEVTKVFRIGHGAIVQEEQLHHKKKVLPIERSQHLTRKMGNTPIITMQHVSLSYGKKQIFQDFSWQVRKGENWAIVGENGTGKTSLLTLITGDNMQSYGQDITLFGKKKEKLSIWDIRAQIGVVSPHMQLSWEENQKGKDIILSGFSDTIGLYKQASEKENEKVQSLAKQLGITPLLTKYFTAMSFGEKRMLLIGRALVKSPSLLILDEVCSGLDETNRKTVLERLEYIGSATQTQLLYVTHRKEELLPCITHMLLLRGVGRERQMQRKGGTFVDFTL